MQKRVFDNPDKIKVIWKANLKKVEGVQVERLSVDVDGKEEIFTAEGLFFAIGHTPATGFLVGSPVGLDGQGYVTIGSGEWPTMTSVEGVFAAGDCVDHRYRQAATAAGMGVAAALDCERWLESK